MKISARDRLLYKLVDVMVGNMKWGNDPDIEKLEKLKEEFREELENATD